MREMSENEPGPDQPVEVPELSSGLLSFYDRLRAAIVVEVERRGGKLGPKVVEVLLLAPDVFVLMARLALDRNVPASSRGLIAGGLAYFLVPVDLLPEAVLGPSGYLEDVILGLLLVERAFSKDLAPWAESYWSGPSGLHRIIGDVTAAAHAVLGENLWQRLQKVLRRRGIEVVSPPQPD
jgi:uncharacterized membrane protein YkvA (DUF1232 family)